MCSTMEVQVLRFCFLLGLAAVCKSADLGVGHGGHEEYEYSPYHYEYNVDDNKEYLHFGQEEEDDGTGNVHGYYHVQLPDGRLQRVDYHISGYSGYIADVKYDGEAHHPSNAIHGGGVHHGGGVLNGGGVHHGGSVHHGGGVHHGGSINHGGIGHHGGGSVHEGLHSTGHFGGSGRLGKAVSVNTSPVEEIKPARQFVHPSPRKSGFEDSSSGAFGGLTRLGKASTFHSDKPAEPRPLKTQKSSFITRKRIERPDTLEVAASEQITTVHKPATFFNDPSSVVASPPNTPAKPLFQFRNAHNQIQTFQEAHQEAHELRKSQHIIGNIQHVPKEVEQLQGAQRHIQDLRRVQDETQGLITAQTHIKSLQNIQHEVQALENGQRTVEKIRNVEREFQGLQNAQSNIKHLQQAERISSNQHSRFPSLIKHDLLEENTNNNQAPRTSTSPDDGFPVRIRGRIIQTP